MHSQHGSFISMFPRIVGILTITLFVLSACGGKEEKKLQRTEGEDDKKIVLSSGGVGPINSSTSFNMHQMTIAFSEYNVIEELNYQSGKPFPVISVSEGVKRLMTIIPDESQKNIFSIVVEDNLITNSLGHRLGSYYYEVYASGTNEECQAGVDDLAGKVICYAPKTPNILYVFTGKTAGEKGVVPEINILQTWGLELIIWRPKQ